MVIGERILMDRGTVTDFLQNLDGRITMDYFQGQE
jgi:hypothetical protein